MDTTYLKARVDGRVVSRAVVIATGVTALAAGKCSAWTSATARLAAGRGVVRSPLEITSG
jgi:hypothetical protein